jgi:hypothetical protein
MPEIFIKFMNHVIHVGLFLRAGALLGYPLVDRFAVFATVLLFNEYLVKFSGRSLYRRELTWYRRRRRRRLAVVFWSMVASSGFRCRDRAGCGGRVGRDCGGHVGRGCGGHVGRDCGGRVGCGCGGRTGRVCRVWSCRSSSTSS